MSVAHSHLFTVNGEEYEYWFEEDVEDDNIKKFHTLRRLNKAGTIYMDWSPYDVPSRQDLIMYVQLGCPTRAKGGPLNRNDLRAMFELHIGRLVVE